jgi:hypothetical protein
MKKNILVLLIAAIFIPTFVWPIGKTTLSEAIKNKWIKAKITGNGNGHYGQCVDFSLENLTSQVLDINVETGRKLICFNDSVQDLMVTQAAALALYPGKTEKLPVYAMCIREHRRAPKSNSNYYPGAMADGNLLELAIIIEKYNIQDDCGQSAVWVLTDSASLNNVTGSSKENNLILTNFLKDAISQAMHKPDATMDEYYISGIMAFELKTESTGSIIAYDLSGKQISVLCENQPFNEGLNRYDFRLVNPAIKKDHEYFVRLIIGGKVIKEISLKAQIN